MSTQQPRPKPTTLTPTPSRRPPTPEQVRAEQARQAEKDRAPKATTLPAKSSTAVTVPAATPALNSADDYFARNPRMVIGRPVRPNLKIGKWIFADDATDEPLPDGVEYAVLFDHAWAGWVRLEAEQPPQYEGGLLFAPEFARPSRGQLGDLDSAQWPLSQFDNNEHIDPWKEAIYLPLEQLPSGELFTIQIQSKPRSAAIFAIDGLLSHCRQMARRDPEHYPVVRLAISSYESRKFGQQFKPNFRIVGKTPKAGAAKADTSIDADLNDELPY